MRLFPAHLREAKDMARDLCDAFSEMRIPANWNDPESSQPTLQQTQEFMATAMGYAGWRELKKLVVEPHVPVYFDTQASDLELLQQFLTRLSSLMGLDYAHGSVCNAVACSGVGYPPKTRRNLHENSTPWGVINDEPVELAPGVTEVSAGSHGGLLLSAERQAAMPAHLRLPDAAYEEDGEVYLVALAFPQEAASMGFNLRDALAYLDLVDHSEEKRAHSNAVCDLLNSGQDVRKLKFPELVEPPLTALEVAILEYLGRCVLSNSLPLRFPGEPERDARLPLIPAKYASYTLAEWVEQYRSIPTVNGTWTTRPGPWYAHWAWQARDAEMVAAASEWPE